jgi:hypothetical protein
MHKHYDYKSAFAFFSDCVRKYHRMTYFYNSFKTNTLYFVVSSCLIAFLFI